MSACSVQLLTDGWECERCAIAWDDGDKAPPCRTLTFTRLREAVIDEAERIEMSQRALVAAGDRQYRYAPALARALELRALARLIDKMKEAQESKA